MKKAILIVAAMTLGLMLCSAAFALVISGTVYFDDVGDHPAACCDVYLWDGANCYGPPDRQTFTVGYGYYAFTNVTPGTYSLKAFWGATACAICTPDGTECEATETDCEQETEIETDTVHDFFFDKDCRCTELDP